MMAPTDTSRAARSAPSLLLLLALFVQGAWSQKTASPVIVEPIRSQNSARPMNPPTAPVGETDSLILKLQENAKKSPKDLSAYDNLAIAYLQKAREAGDI